MILAKETTYAVIGGVLLLVLTITLFSGNYFLKGEETSESTFTSSEETSLDVITGEQVGCTTAAPCCLAKPVRTRCSMYDRLEQLYNSFPLGTKACSGKAAEYRLIESCDKGCFSPSAQSSKAMCVNECSSAPGTFYQQSWQTAQGLSSWGAVKQKVLKAGNRVFVVGGGWNAPVGLKIYDAATGNLLKDSSTLSLNPVKLGSDETADFNVNSAGSAVYLLNREYDSYIGGYKYLLGGYTLSTDLATWTKQFETVLFSPTRGGMRAVGTKLDRDANNLYVTLYYVGEYNSNTKVFSTKLTVDKIVLPTTSTSLPTITNVVTLGGSSVNPYGVFRRFYVDVRPNGGEVAVVFPDKAEGVLRYCANCATSTQMVGIKAKAEGGALDKVTGVYYDQTMPILYVVDNTLGTSAGSERILRYSLSSSTTVPVLLSSPQLASPLTPLNTSIVGIDYALYVADRSKNKIEKYDNRGVFENTIYPAVTGSKTRLYSFFVDSSNKAVVYVYDWVEERGNKVTKHSPC